jgi:murein L,D-transpeptidase YafK
VTFLGGIQASTLGKACWIGVLSALLTGIGPRMSSAVEVELLDVAPDRVERQRAYARGAVLPNTPDVGQLAERLAAKGLAKGSPIYIRIFKASSELELWMQKGDRYVLLDTYPVCHWTGTIGPKLREGDRQSPEGFYSVSARQMRLVGRWRSAFNLGFPNAYDQLNKRTGSYILVHGGCSSTGCFAMTDLIQDEIYGLAREAHNKGQFRFQVHVFPFRMTDEAMAAHADSPWLSFWQDLKPAYDAFERTKVPPRIAICGLRYSVGEGDPNDRGADAPLSVLKPVSTASLASGGPVCREHETTAAVLQSAMPRPQVQRQVEAQPRPAAARQPPARRPAPQVRAAAPKSARERPAKSARAVVGTGGQIGSAAVEKPAPTVRSFNGLGQLVDSRAPRVVQYGQ